MELKVTVSALPLIYHHHVQIKKERSSSLGQINGCIKTLVSLEGKRMPLFTVPGIDSGWSIRNVSSPAQEEMMLDTNN